MLTHLLRTVCNIHNQILMLYNLFIGKHEHFPTVDLIKQTRQLNSYSLFIRLAESYPLSWNYIYLFGILCAVVEPSPRTWQLVFTFED